jgi:hypothetical protein
MSDFLERFEGRNLPSSVTNALREADELIDDYKQSLIEMHSANLEDLIWDIKHNKIKVVDLTWDLERLFEFIDEKEI